jgi:hypothetical protein
MKIIKFPPDLDELMINYNIIVPQIQIFQQVIMRSRMAIAQPALNYLLIL